MRKIDTDIKLNGHVVKLLSKYFYLYFILVLLSALAREELLEVTVNTETHTCHRLKVRDCGVLSSNKASLTLARERSRKRVRGSKNLKMEKSSNAVSG